MEPIRQPPPQVFILRSRIGRGIFALREDVLEITAANGRRFAELVVPIKSISADYEVVAYRSYLVLVLLLVPALLLEWGACFLFTQDLLPRSLGLYPTLFGLALAAAALRMVPRIECFVFTDHWKRPLFSIIRERGQAQDCEAFLHALLDRVEQVDAPVAAAPSAVTAVSVPIDQANVVIAEEPMWKLAIAGGILSVLIPVMAVRSPELRAYAMPLILVAAICGVVAAVCAFLKNERPKWWSLLGIVLSAFAILAVR